MRPRRRVALLAVLGCLAASSGCVVGRPRPTDPDAIGPVSATVRDAYLAYWAAWTGANESSDPEFPALAGHTADPHREVLRAQLADARRRGQVVTGTVGHDIRGMYSYNGWYRVVDCVDLTRWLIVDARDGQPLQQLVQRPRQLSSVSLESVDGRWKATHAQLLGDC